MASRDRKTENDIDISLESFSGSRIVFAIVIIVLLLIPFVGMIWASSDETVENRELAPAPSFVKEDGLFNYQVLSDAGDYFDDHYAYRSRLIDAGAHIYASIFGVSTADTVNVGTDGWLYYAGTLGDYQDTKPISANEARNIAYNIRLIQDICEDREISFAFAIAPNKNSIYAGNMPYYLPEIDSKNMELINEALKDFGVNGVNLHEVISSNDERLYFLRDSHWTEKGALLGHDAIAEAAGFATLPLDPDSMIVKDDYTGDLSKMLFPDSTNYENNWYFEGINDASGATHSLRSGSYWNFVEGESVEDSTIETTPSDPVKGDALSRTIANTSKNNGTLLMFRDSFGNSLIPYLASEFSHATFSKMLPMNLLLLDDEEPDCVLVERAQRHVDYFAEEAPLVICPIVDLGIETEKLEPEQQVVEVETSTNGPLGIVKGFVDGDVQWGEGEELLLKMTDSEGLADTYKAFALTDSETGNDNGFCASVDLELWEGYRITCDLIINGEDGARLISSFTCEF